MQEKRLVDRLQSIKQYFFLEAGDFFIHFMDAAESELVKEVSLISQEKLQSLLEMGIRTSSAEKDPFKDDVYCYLASSPFTSIVATYQGLQKKELNKLEFMLREDNGSDNRKKPPNGSKGYDYFTLGYNVEWPLNLILTETNIIQYKLVFKHLFALRYTELELYKCWVTIQTLKSTNLPRSTAVLFLLVQRMINFIRNVIYNFCCEVIDAHWKVLLENLQNVSMV